MLSGVSHPYSPTTLSLRKSSLVRPIATLQLMVGPVPGAFHQLGTCSAHSITSGLSSCALPGGILVFEAFENVRQIGCARDASGVFANFIIRDPGD